MKQTELLINTDENSKKEKDWGKIAIFGFFGVIVSFVIVVLLADVVTAKDDYKPLTPDGQATYNAALLTLCQSEKSLANAKLMDMANGVKMDSDLNALYLKRDKDCAAAEKAAQVGK
jgi:hypothetical protein